MEEPVKEVAVSVLKRRKSKKMRETAFAPTIKIMLADKKTILVPIDKASSDAQRQILVAKARKFVEDQLERLSTASLTPAEVKDLVKAVADVDGLQREQYVAAVNSKADSELGKGLQGIIKNAAQGAAEGTAAGFMEKMRQMDEAAKKTEKAAAAKVITV